MLERRVCLLTGAGGVLGTTFCRLFGDRYDIAAVYRYRQPAAPTQSVRFVDPIEPGTLLPENDHPHYAIRADLAEDGELERVVELALARFGRIDLLVNAAVHSVWAPIVDSKALLESAQRQFLVNALVPLRLATLIAREFWRDRDSENRTVNRNVVNVSSIAGIYVYPHSGQSVYSASKAALNNLTCHMASEFAAFAVRVNATAPDGFPRIVPTDDVARSIVRFDEGDATGRILVIGADGERMI